VSVEIRVNPDGSIVARACTLEHANSPNPSYQYLAVIAFARNDMKPHLIVFEGPDGVGKSTLVKLLAEYLNTQNIPNQVLSFPGDRPGTLGKLVYEIHHSPGHFDITTLSPIGLQALHIAAHLDSIVQTIAPAISSGNWVVLDRFWWSTWVYGRAADIMPEVLDALIQSEKLQWGRIIPSVVFLVERGAALRPEQPDEQFAVLSNLYAKISRSQTKEHEVIRLTDADVVSAHKVIAKWVDARVQG
jgi:thymidylate kinase